MSDNLEDERIIHLADGNLMLISDIPKHSLLNPTAKRLRKAAEYDPNGALIGIYELKAVM